MCDRRKEEARGQETRVTAAVREEGGRNAAEEAGSAIAGARIKSGRRGMETRMRSRCLRFLDQGLTS